MGHTQSSLLDMIGYTNDKTVSDDSMSEERRTITDTLFCFHSVDHDLNMIGFTANITQPQTNDGLFEEHRTVDEQ